MSQAETVSCTSGETNNSTHRLKSSPQDASLSRSLPLAPSYLAELLGGGKVLKLGSLVAVGAGEEHITAAAGGLAGNG